LDDRKDGYIRNQNQTKLLFGHPSWMTNIVQLKARSTNISRILRIQLEYSQNISPFSETNNARICIHIYFNVLCLVYGVFNTFTQQ